MSDILIDNVSKEYGDQIVLEKISLHITSRSFVALVGPSGCGKTTFLRLLLGEESATGGSIAIDGVPLIAEPSADRGVVFQRYSVFPHLTVLGNVLLGLEFRGSPIAARLLAIGIAWQNAARMSGPLVTFPGQAANWSTQSSTTMTHSLAIRFAGVRAGPLASSSRLVMAACKSSSVMPAPAHDA